MSLPLPPASRAALLAAMDDLHEDAVAAFAALGLPREVAEAVVWLCSSRASYLTGAMVAADAGYLAR